MVYKLFEIIKERLDAETITLLQEIQSVENMKVVRSGLGGMKNNDFSIFK